MGVGGFCTWEPGDIPAQEPPALNASNLEVSLPLCLCLEKGSGFNGGWGWEGRSGKSGSCQLQSWMLESLSLGHE